MSHVRPDSEETVRLLDEIRSGQPSLGQLLERHRPAVRDQIRLRMDDRLSARIDLDDVIQETEFDACRRIRSYLDRRPMPFHLWLRKTAQERFLMLRRRHVGAAVRSVDREWRLPDRSSVALGRLVVANSQASPSEALNEQELAARVRQAISRLPEADREILLMRTYEDLSYDEIGCLLGIEPAAARKRNGRALVRLHRLLSDEGLTESQI